MTGNQNLTIQAELRKAGKSTSRNLRTQRMVPAVVYGPKTKNFSFSIGENDAVKYSRHGFENTIFTLKSDDKSLDGMKVLRKDLDVHPVSRRPIHMDFFAPDMTQTVRVEVEVRLVGKAPGVMEGGLVSQVKREVEIETLPLEIPEYFELDISNLQLDESLHVSDIKFPAGVKVISGEKETIVSCAEVAEETASTTPAAAEGAAAPATEKAGE
ncbi:MAG TPA: 50S ribosomal protein L25 [Bdellovibrionales bacterium]|nr:50S ribosomal protein L25 [Pseudobdellovibrionaceae bacterium]HAG90386.1 50S ribosomal protein L25 [Bdellovibrionales bacterium]|tara:strand:+ start:652 stop:1290 length:639 start_codon:yes stop_codon:yes gene_type:complete